ncbi:glycosyltransferase [Ovoidimarina sediminis]|uniref:glycosyltransferase n=1 Tax=Ovoidimarina sediminis TaxID=3079856 RepID=UPI00290EA4ED|nr:glycosyltransferase [Rhodophyticola sp. MJ-SS7]MDU8944071.1 glycosyltransferase [Rhodophyticola sp. MJ-SS7]
MPDTTHPDVLVVIVTFNQAALIGDALDGVLAQDTPFPVRLLVHDDASTDGTREIVADYAARHPNIEAILQDENQFSQGKRINYELWPRYTADYIAFLDGDDAWTDPGKLASQITFMEANPGCALCQTASIYVDVDTGRRLRRVPHPRHRREKSVLADFVPGNFVQTSAAVLRRSALPELPEEFQELPFGDWAIFALAARAGWVGYIDRDSVLYRVHAGNFWFGRTRADRLEKTRKVRDFLIRHIDEKDRAPWIAYRDTPLGRRLYRLRRRLEQMAGR